MPPQPGPAPKEDSYGPVKRGDTLSKIAMQYKTDDVTLDQMLVLLFRNNKSAFFGSNMNRLKTGKVLSIPDPSEVADLPQKEARKEVRLQVADFNAYRERLASAAGATMPAPDQSGAAAGGKVTGPVQDKATPAHGRAEGSAEAVSRGTARREVAGKRCRTRSAASKRRSPLATRRFTRPTSGSPSSRRP